MGTRETQPVRVNDGCKDHKEFDFCVYHQNTERGSVSEQHTQHRKYNPLMGVNNVNSLYQYCYLALEAVYR
jgi:hypothetical protein